ncbi:hypothetical protein [Alistipes sp.]|uniref:hypothetical protein n=1 Tax=Alistipes sp. TaxID=1872444 RepID=UPI003AB8A285
MKTLLDIERENAAIIEERTANIKGLRSQLVEAQATAREIPGDRSLASDQERRIVQREIDRLNRYIESEQKAIDQLTGATESDLDAVMDIMKK